jgi:hypothetical protein
MERYFKRLPKKKKKLVSLIFENMKVSTRTFTATTNVIVDIDEVAKTLPVLQSRTLPDLKQIRKGTVVSTNYLGKIRGINLKPRKKNKRYFRNSFTVVVHAGDKLINFKVCRNGTFQITGALTFEHALCCITCIWDHIKKDKKSILKALIVPAMRNLDFTLGIKINREALDKYINDKYPVYKCLLETSFGYTGLNVKKKIIRPIQELQILKVTSENYILKKEFVNYTEYLSALSPASRDQKLKHARYNTFLVFHSGKIIQSGLSARFMKEDFEHFIKILNEAYDLGILEEKLIDD